MNEASISATAKRVSIGTCIGGAISLLQYAMDCAREQRLDELVDELGVQIAALAYVGADIRASPATVEVLPGEMATLLEAATRESDANFGTGKIPN